MAEDLNVMKIKVGGDSPDRFIGRQPHSNGAAVRITHAYDKGVDRIVRAWSPYCKNIAVYEHDDDGANHLHCHLHIEGFSCVIKRLQQLAKETGVPLQKKGENGKRATSLMAFRQADYDFHPSGYAYLTKGKYEPKYLQGFTTEQTNIWKQTWVPREDHVKQDVWQKDNDAFKLLMPLREKVLHPSEKEEEAFNQNYFDQIVGRARYYIYKSGGCKWPPNADARLRNIVISWCMNNMYKVRPIAR